MSLPDWEGSMLDECPRTKARYSNNAKGPIETSIGRKSHRVGSLIPWDEIGTTVLWAAVAAGIFWWLVNR